MSLQFAPGESNVVVDKFSPSVVLFWLKTEIGASSTRVVVKEPNTILGVIPLGAKDSAYPLKNVASVGVDARFRVARLIFGGLSLLIGFGLGGLPGVLLMLWGVSLLANTMSASLKIQNNGGGIATVDVSILEKGKLETLREQINQRVFADQEGLRHAEMMQAQGMNLQAANLNMMTQHMNAQQAMQQSAQQHQESMAVRQAESEAHRVAAADQPPAVAGPESPQS